MERVQFFLKAMNAELYKRAAWVITAFSIAVEEEDAWKADPYPYRIVRKDNGIYYVDPDNGFTLTAIAVEDPTQPIYAFKDRVDVKAGSIPNLATDLNTSYGNILWNFMCLVYPFGSKIPYMEGMVRPGKVEEIIVEMLADNPDKVEDRLDNKVYIDEYLKFTNAMFNLSAYTQLCVPACSPKSITPPPGIIELRDRLLAENKDKLNDPSTIARIDAELVKHLREWLKDDVSMGFLTDKSFDVVRRKLYLMGGAEQGLDDDVELELVPKSLSEGWDPSKFPIMNTVSRAGSFNRGAQTELGGEATKWLFRASSNMSVTHDDCGSRLGVEILAQPGEERKLIGFTAMIDVDNIKIITKITRENVGEYMGKKIRLRSPMYCQLPKTDFCKICVGDRLATSPTGLSTAVAEYGSAFLGIFMSSMHSSALKLAKMDFKTTMV